MTGKSDSDSSLVKAESFEQTEDNSKENEHAHTFEFDHDAVAAIHAVEEDFGRQLELASNRQNAMVQSAGIILAFASILLIEVIRLLYPMPNNVCDIIALVLFLTCCTIGISTIWQWKNWELYSGFKFNEVVYSFNRRRFLNMHLLLLKGVIDAHDMMTRNNYIIREKTSYMVISLSVGIIFMLIGLVIEWA